MSQASNITIDNRKASSYGTYYKDNRTVISL
jgi:hypothetical protein